MPAVLPPCSCADLVRRSRQLARVFGNPSPLPPPLHARPQRASRPQPLSPLSAGTALSPYTPMSPSKPMRHHPAATYALSTQAAVSAFHRFTPVFPQLTSTISARGGARAGKGSAPHSRALGCAVDFPSVIRTCGLHRIPTPRWHRWGPRSRELSRYRVVACARKDESNAWLGANGLERVFRLAVCKFIYGVVILVFSRSEITSIEKFVLFLV